MRVDSKISAWSSVVLGFTLLASASAGLGGCVKAKETKATSVVSSDGSSVLLDEAVFLEGNEADAGRTVTIVEGVSRSTGLCFLNAQLQQGVNPDSADGRANYLEDVSARVLSGEAGIFANAFPISIARLRDAVTAEPALASVASSFRGIDEAQTRAAREVSAQARGLSLSESAAVAGAGAGLSTQFGRVKNFVQASVSKFPFSNSDLELAATTKAGELLKIQEGLATNSREYAAIGTRLKNLQKAHVAAQTLRTSGSGRMSFRALSRFLVDAGVEPGEKAMRAAKDLLGSTRAIVNRGHESVKGVLSAARGGAAPLAGAADKGLLGILKGGLLKPFMSVKNFVTEACLNGGGGANKLKLGVCAIFTVGSVMALQGATTSLTALADGGGEDAAAFDAVEAASKDTRFQQAFAASSTVSTFQVTLENRTQDDAMRALLARVGSTREDDGASCQDRLYPKGREGQSFDGSQAR